MVAEKKARDQQNENMMKLTQNVNELTKQVEKIKECCSEKFYLNLTLAENREGVGGNMKIKLKSIHNKRRIHKSHSMILSRSIRFCLR